MSAPAYELRDVVLARASGFRLQIDRLEIPLGKTLALLGPTGSGKTTLLRLLTGIERPQAGVVLFKGQPLNASTPIDLLRQIALVPQKPLLLRGSVRSNLAYGMRARGKPIGSDVEAVAAQLGLAPLLGRDARTLSGGQTQLVALGRALVLQPKVLLLDEPTSNLDPAFVATVERATSALSKQQTTIVWSTHNLLQAKRVSDRVALLLDGEVVETTDTATFFDRPVDSRSQAFLSGEMVF
jgi:tungstate transport system ATP-binding protein